MCAQVYEACRFEGNAGDTLDMLAAMEARLEDLLLAIEHMDEEYVKRAEKEKARARREAQRLLHQKEEEDRCVLPPLRSWGIPDGRRRSYEKKLQAQMRRAQEPIHVKTGKPVMHRSRPPEKKKQQRVDDGAEEARRIEARYFT